MYIYNYKNKFNMNYDIFISYRRTGGYETAKHLYDLLTHDGYSVSFDIDTLRNGDFDSELLSRIDQCKDFIIILNKGVFDRCIDSNFNPKKDWLRNELAYALKKRKNIIPIMLAGFSDFPSNLPQDIAAIERKNGPKYDQYYFDDFYNRLKERFLESKVSQGVRKGGEILVKINTDLACHVYIDGLDIGEAFPDSTFTYSCPKGIYSFKFLESKDKKDFIEIKSVDISQDSEYNIELQPIYFQRIINEQEKHDQLVGYTFENIMSDVEGLSTLAIHDGLILVSKNKKYSYLDINGNVAFPEKYDAAYDFENGYAVVGKKIKSSIFSSAKLKYGIVDKKGDIIIPLKYDVVRVFKDGFAAVASNQMWGFVDKQGHELFHLQFDEVQDFNSHIAQVKKHDKWGIINEKGELTSDIKFDKIFDFYEGTALASTSSDLGIINTKGEWILKSTETFYPVMEFHEGYAIVSNYADDDETLRYGYVDIHGELLTELKYEEAFSFHEGLALVKYNGKYTFINTAGFEICKNPQYDKAEDFNHGVAIIKENGKWGIINKLGYYILKPIYDLITPFHEELACVAQNGKVGFVDYTGKFIIPIQYRWKYEDDLSENDEDEDDLRAIAPTFENGLCRISSASLGQFDVTELLNNKDNDYFIDKKGRKYDYNAE